MSESEKAKKHKWASFTGLGKRGSALGSMVYRISEESEEHLKAQRDRCCPPYSGADFKTPCE
jgi:hypothetical protein